MRHLYIIIFILSITNLYRPQSVYAQADHIFTTIGESNGLRNVVITSIAEDGNGFIWMGSPTGLVRYDGYHSAYFNNIQDGLKGNCVIDLGTDSYGNIWISTENGVSKYDIKQESFTNYPLITDGEPSYTYQANTIICPANGKILFLSNHGMLCEFDSAQNAFCPILESYTKEHSPKACFACSDGNLLVFNQKGRDIQQIDYSGKCIREYIYIHGNDGAYINNANTIMGNGDGTMYLGSDNGLFLIDNINKSITHIAEAGGIPMPQQIKALYRDHDGLIWIGTNAEELHIYNDKDNTLEVITSDKNHQSRIKLNSCSVMDILEDSRGLIWLATWQGASYTEQQSSRLFQSITSQDFPDILTQNLISDVVEVGDRLVIASDGGGLTFWKPEENKRLDLWQTNGMRNSSILTLATDSKGNIYNGGYNHGLSRISSNYSRIDNYVANPENPNALESDFVRDILIENDNRIWVLTNGGGLHLLDPDTKKIERIRQDRNGNKPVSPYGICIAQAPNKNIIWGTYHGLVCYDYLDNKITNHVADPQNPTTISHNWVYCVRVDSKGKIWVGTASGLNIFDQASGTFRLPGNNADLANICCYSMEEDSRGYIWIGTSNGIMKINSENCQVERTYGSYDGIVSNNFYVNGSRTTKDGTMYFCNMDGLIRLNPNKITHKPLLPKPTIVGLLIDYKLEKPGAKTSPLQQSITRTDYITLNSKQNSFAIQFASLGYLDCESYSYMYRILGGDNENWIDIGTRREIDFISMAPGKYTIQICARNSDNTSSVPTELTIEVLPPWYATTFMKILMVILGITTALILYKLRIEHLKQQRETLRLQVMERTEELSALNDELQNSLQRINSKNIAIQGSIKYAQTIQQALLTKQQDFGKFFEPAVVYMPKDIVSGDFFWMKECKGMIFASNIDCTGHGVPGAFMSLIANSILNDIIDTEKLYEPAQILSELSWRISRMLEQERSDNKDGMDMALCRFGKDPSGKITQLTYAGAKNPVYLQKAGSSQYEILPADRKSIAGGIREGQILTRLTFSQTERSVESGDVIYMYSDGIIDHTNQQRKRFGRKRLFEMLSSMQNMNMEMQAQIIAQTISEYANGSEQRDDISVLGLKIL
ncbi:MAG: SpoIIE family protein phosphatase [Bacteroidales bacterium]|nr:SpoIIE family protein phosphatase [Bacteroidales bacterium]